MPNSDLLPSLLYKINENQQALEAAIMELTLWIEQHGSGEVGGNVRGALETISKNEEFKCGATDLQRQPVLPPKTDPVKAVLPTEN